VVSCSSSNDVLHKVPPPYFVLSAADIDARSVEPY
jgi:hypothetical protein